MSGWSALMRNHCCIIGVWAAASVKRAILWDQQEAERFSAAHCIACGHETDLEAARRRWQAVPQRPARRAGWPPQEPYLRAAGLPGSLACHCARRIRGESGFFPEPGARAGGRLPALRRVPPEGVRSMEKAIELETIGYAIGDCAL